MGPLEEISNSVTEFVPHSMTYTLPSSVGKERYMVSHPKKKKKKKKKEKEKEKKRDMVIFSNAL